MVHRLVTLLKRVWRALVGQQYRIYIDDVHVATIRSRKKDIEVVLQPGIVKSGGPGILRTEPPQSESGCKITVIYLVNSPLGGTGTFVENLRA